MSYPPGGTHRTSLLAPSTEQRLPRLFTLRCVRLRPLRWNRCVHLLKTLDRGLRRAHSGRTATPDLLTPQDHRASVLSELPIAWPAAPLCAGVLLLGPISRATPSSPCVLTDHRYPAGYHGLRFHRSDDAGQPLRPQLSTSLAISPFAFSRCITLFPKELPEEGGKDGEPNDCDDEKNLDVHGCL